MKQLPQLAPPGQLLAYNNAAIVVAGGIIETLTGKPYETALQVTHRRANARPSRMQTAPTSPTPITIAGSQSTKRSTEEAARRTSTTIGSCLMRRHRTRTTAPETTTSSSSSATSSRSTPPISRGASSRPRQARPRRPHRSRGRRDRRPGRGRRPGRDRRAGLAPRALHRPQLGAGRGRRGRIARLLAAQAGLPRRVARPPGEARRGSRSSGTTSRPSSPTSTRAAAAGRCSSSRRCRRGTSCSTSSRRSARPYLAALLAVDHYATYPEQLGLGVLTWRVLGRGAHPRLSGAPARRRSASSSSRRSARSPAR